VHPLDDMSSWALMKPRSSARLSGASMASCHGSCRNRASPHVLLEAGDEALVADLEHRGAEQRGPLIPEAACSPGERQRVEVAAQRQANSARKCCM
jgi:hypothetical protein